MAELYVYVAKKFGINAKYQRFCLDMKHEIGGKEVLAKIDTRTQEHVCPVVQLEG